MSADQHYMIAKALYKQGRYEEAIRELDEAIRLDPYNPDYYNEKGMVLTELGRYREAIVEFDKALQLDPNYSIAHINKGVRIVQVGAIRRRY